MSAVTHTDSHPAIGTVRLAEGIPFRVTQVRVNESDGWVIYSGHEVTLLGAKVIGSDGEGNFVTEFVIEEGLS